MGKQSLQFISSRTQYTDDYSDIRFQVNVSHLSFEKRNGVRQSRGGGKNLG